MLLYVTRRLIFVIISLFGVLTMVFFLSRVIPGDPAAVVAGPKATAEQLEYVRHLYGFDKPVLTQYGLYLKNLLLRLDLGRSVYTRGPVTRAIVERFPATLELTTAAMIFAIIIGILIGVFSAVHWNTGIDQCIRVVTISGIAIPGFWLALLLQWLFFYSLGILPAGGRIAGTLSRPTHLTGLYLIDSLIEGDVTKLGSCLTHLLLPAFTLSLASLAQIARITRGTVLEVLHEHYVTKARSIGLREGVVIFKHVLRNALMPILTAIGMYYGLAVGGSVVIESVFSWRGMGLFMYQAVIMTDFNGIMGVTLVFALIYLLLNTLVDILYGFVNPQIRLA